MNRVRVSSETWAGAIVKDDLVTSALEVEAEAEQRAGPTRLGVCEWSRGGCVEVGNKNILVQLQQPTEPGRVDGLI